MYYDGGNMKAIRLKKQDNIIQLFIEGKPFLILGGELHNSSSSSIEYMKPIWQRIVDLNCNTVLAVVSWELIEPEKGKYDFALVSGLINEARKYKLKLILLWFGSWKNGMSSYIPGWVKKDFQKYPRAIIHGNNVLEVLSTFSDTNQQTDSRAFAALMKHIKKIDEKENTVIMMQVENEVGILGDSRDKSALANKAFRKPVPLQLMDYLCKNEDKILPETKSQWKSAGYKKSGTWPQVFGKSVWADEIFMAWHYASYIDAVAVAGKKEYDIPMFVNAWLNEPKATPGHYPAGGPLPRVMDIWLAGAPHIDFLSPDIYAPDFPGWCKKYTQCGNPLFIPEMRREKDGPRNIVYAFGEYNPIGTSPFAVDSIKDSANSELAKSYSLISRLQPFIFKGREKGMSTGFLLDKNNPKITKMLGNYELTISLDNLFWQQAEQGYGMIICIGSDEYIGAGCGFGVAFKPVRPGLKYAGIISTDELLYKNGKWVPDRRLNGDEDDQGQSWRFPSKSLTVEKCIVYQYN